MLSKSTTAQFTQLEEFWSTVGKFMLGGLRFKGCHGLSSNANWVFLFAMELEKVFTNSKITAFWLTDMSSKQYNQLFQPQK